MDLNFTAEEEAFRTEVRCFLDEHLPPRTAHKVRHGLRLTREDMAQWHAILNARGWLASHWPREYGGTGWSAVERFIFDNECALAGAPRIVPFGAKKSWTGVAFICSTTALASSLPIALIAFR